MRKKLTRLASATIPFFMAHGAMAEDWPDPLLTLPGTPGNVARGLEIDAYQLGVSAWVWG